MNFPRLCRYGARFAEPHDFKGIGEIGALPDAALKASGSVRIIGALEEV